MCGIAAVFAYGGGAPAVDRGEMERVVERMRPRGPDGGGVWIADDHRVALGARRLAIIDLSPDGSQPMHDGDLHIVFNGEIYNHKELRARLERFGIGFRSTSDTEVLLRMYRRYGAEMVELLRGMYAFAIFDAATRRMFVARDPYGIKPLYVADDGKTLRLASTVKALLAGGAVSRALDPAGIAAFFLMGSVPQPFTTFAAIRAVEPGTSFFIDANGPAAPRRFYSIAATLARAREQKTIASLVEPSELLRELTTESLAAHLVSDVPVGAFLSGGIDSSVLVALAHQAREERLRTVTLAFDVARGTALDESPVAERFAKDVDAQHVTRTLTRAEFLADLPRFFDAMDQPTINGVNTWFVSKAAAETGLKVAISGLGGDELFGSYPSFRDVPRIVRASGIPAAAPLIAAVTRNPKARYIARGRTYSVAYFLKRGLFMPEELPDLIGPDAAKEATTRLMATLDDALVPDPATPFGRVAALEAAMYMRNQLLRDTDWASMAHSLEVRVPLVDAILLRHLAPLLLVEGVKSKRYFANAPSPPLPEYLQSRGKSGFSVPIGKWLDLPDDGTTTRMRSWSKVVYESFVAS